jgi:riboflavin synthase
VATAVAAELSDGESIAVNGVCLTVTSHDQAGFSADLSRATLAVTSFAAIDRGRLVNLERPVRADARMGGHFVLGHVDGTGHVVTFRRDGEAHWLEVEIPAALEPLVISKGSIAVNGISLTVASLATRLVGMQIVPFTYQHTSLSDVQVGDVVNLEVDVLGKYVARLLAFGHTVPAEPVSLER